MSTSCKNDEGGGHVSERHPTGTNDEGGGHVNERVAGMSMRHVNLLQERRDCCSCQRALTLLEQRRVADKSIQQSSTPF
ncbi:hypothetical protein HNY73_020996 [Argiope bruennichi]|uniref:Uncharacterized protein n=1 Tax=Argiope bruennichi TaxID=94029 RepID=A0A8T0E9W6_ARGBR|nr:hypothetical protein HNY73_020996 [Argiope bruennichi]